MLSQVIQTALSFDLSPARPENRGQITTTSYHSIRAAKSTVTGTFNNDYKYKRRWPGRRLPQNAWALHRPGKRARDRLRTLVAVT